MIKERKITLGILIAVLIAMLTCFGLSACSSETKYTVAFHSNGGSVVEDVVLEGGETLNAPKEPVKEGWTFVCWCKDADLLEPFVFPTVMPKESFNLYAKWTQSDLRTLTFDSMGGSAVNSVTAAALSTLTEPEAPTKEGRFFSGWYADAEFTAPFDFVMPARNATVYARWLKLEEATHFDLNSGWVSPDDGAYLLTESAQGTHVEALSGKDEWSYIGITIPYNVKDYSAFVITLTGTQGQDILVKCQNGGVDAVETRYTMNGQQNQTFVWTVKPENLTDGVEPMNFYIFVRPGDMGAGAVIDITSFGLYRVRGEDEPLQSGLFFVTDGGSAVSPVFAVTGGNISAPDVTPKKPGYNFAGWYEDEDCTTAFSFGKMPEGKTFVYAKWEPNTDVTLTFDSKGGSAVNSITAPATSLIDPDLIPDAPVKGNLIFDDWYIDEQYTEKFSMTNMPASDTTVYARWTVIDEENKYQLSLNFKDREPWYSVEVEEGGTRVTVGTKEAYDTFGTLLDIDAQEYTYFKITFTGTAGKEILFKCQNGGVETVEKGVIMTGEEQTFWWRVKAENLPDGTDEDPMNFYMFLEPGVDYYEGGAITTPPVNPTTVFITEIALCKLKDAPAEVQ